MEVNVIKVLLCLGFIPLLIIIPSLILIILETKFSKLYKFLCDTLDLIFFKKDTLKSNLEFPKCQY